MHVSRRRSFVFFVCFVSVVSLRLPARAQSFQEPPHDRDPHGTAEWATIAPHLPNPITASPERLETAGDVLRARRFPEDALTFYRAAVFNGGDRSRLLKKEGVLQLEMQQGLLAHLSFQQAVRLNKKDAEGWNNLGASDYMLGNSRSAISEYKHAVKLRKTSAVFHSNLALAYFEARNARDARQELARAVALDPEILHHNDTGGYNLQVLASSHYAEICYEMARVYAAQGDAETAISWLTKATDRGMNVRARLKDDTLLSPYLQDDRVKVMLANNDQMKNKTLPTRVKPPGLSSATDAPQ